MDRKKFLKYYLSSLEWQLLNMDKKNPDYQELLKIFQKAEHELQDRFKNYRQNDSSLTEN
jgi:hypothetical protein